LIVDDKGDQVTAAGMGRRGCRATQAGAQDLSPPRRPRSAGPQGDVSPPRRTRPERLPGTDASSPRRPRRRSPSVSPPDPPCRSKTTSGEPSRPHQPRPSPSPSRDPGPEGGDISPPRRRRRHDSPSPLRRRRRHDTPSPSPTRDGDPPKRGGQGTQDDRGAVAVAVVSESGKTASTRPKEDGLKTGAEFRAELEAQKDAKAHAWGEGAKDAGVTGQHAETVVRDRRGRKLEMLSEFLNQEAYKEGKAAKEAKEEYEWGRGKVQKEKDEDHRRELEDIKNAPFARYESDLKLERARKEEIRADDPMAAYMLQKQRDALAQEATRSGKVLKPEYKGPPPKPNRFNVRPGYRWDGIDRGNGFEARWFKRQSELVTKHERDRAWGMSDL